MFDAMRTARILLPAPGIALEKWAVIACDQHTSEPEYWKETRAIVGDAPSALNVTLPEVWLGESESRIPAIHATMRDYLDRGVWQTAVADGFVYIERETSTGLRCGLLACLDLETYDYARGSASLIRPTEATVVERVPPRARIRAGAEVELPHVMMLIDDPMKTVIEPLTRKRDDLRTLYDFDLMQGGGHLCGRAVEGADAEAVLRAMSALHDVSGGLLFAVGDGNHSLAAAKKCWVDLKPTLSEAEQKDHPSRYALVELVNLGSDAMQFEPIHRVLFGVKPEDVIADYRAYLSAIGADEGEGDDVVAFDMTHEWRFKSSGYPLPKLQAFLDQYLAAHPGASIDYIHGEDALRKLVDREDALGLMPRAFAKSELFGFIRENGTLPRKSFSIGEANEKRYYLEARKIV